MGRVRNAGIGIGTSGSPQCSLSQETVDEKVEELVKQNMLEQLEKAGVKYTPEDVLFVTKDKTGQLIWLEKGNKNAGLEHILNGNGSKPGHAFDFETKHSVERDNLTNHLKNCITHWNVEYSILTVKNGREGYEKLYSSQNQYYLVSGIGKNGFIVTAYPVNERTAQALIRRNKE